MRLMQLQSLLLSCSFVFVMTSTGVEAQHWNDSRTIFHMSRGSSMTSLYKKRTHVNSGTGGIPVTRHLESLVLIKTQSSEIGGSVTTRFKADSALPTSGLENTLSIGMPSPVVFDKIASVRPSYTAATDMMTMSRSRATASDVVVLDDILRAIQAARATALPTVDSYASQTDGVYSIGTRTATGFGSQSTSLSSAMAKNVMEK